MLYEVITSAFHAQAGKAEARTDRFLLIHLLLDLNRRTAFGKKHPSYNFV